MNPVRGGIMRGVKLLLFYSHTLAFTIDNSKLNRTLAYTCNTLTLNPRIMPPLRGSHIFLIFCPGVPPLARLHLRATICRPYRGSGLGSLTCVPKFVRRGQRYIDNKEVTKNKMEGYVVNIKSASFFRNSISHRAFAL